jgi:hypothetical protein
MRQDEINFRYDQAINRANYVSIWSFLFSLIFFFVVIIGGIIYIPMILDDLWMFGIVGGFIAFIFIRSNVVVSSRRKRFFNNPDIHTHTDNCPTCGALFGPTRDMSTLPPYVRRMVHKCRHASGQLDYAE